MEELDLKELLSLFWSKIFQIIVIVLGEKEDSACLQDSPVIFPYSSFFVNPIGFHLIKAFEREGAVAQSFPIDSVVIDCRAVQYNLLRLFYDPGHGDHVFKDHILRKTLTIKKCSLN